jgi:hypothetical protein
LRPLFSVVCICSWAKLCSSKHPPGVFLVLVFLAAKLPAAVKLAGNKIAEVQPFSTLCYACVFAVIPHLFMLIGWEVQLKASKTELLAARGMLYAANCSP